MDWKQQLPTKVSFTQPHLFPWYFNVSKIHRCFDHCSSNGKDFYGLVYGDQCQCGNTKPNSSYKKAESYCGTTCPGDSSAKCGGSDNRSNIYQIATTPTTTTTTQTSSTTTTTATTTPGKDDWLWNGSNRTSLITAFFQCQVDAIGISNFNLASVEINSWTSDYSRTQIDRGRV